MSTRDWSIQEIARLGGTTSRTLRHYGELGLVEPSRIGGNGYRYYDEAALARLQRVLLLRDLGLGLPAIAQVLAGQTDDVDALSSHLEWLRQEKDRLDRQIESVETTISKKLKGEELMAEEMLNGFDHTRYRGEVEQRWGEQAFADGDTWWKGLAATDKAEWMHRQRQFAADWIAASEAGENPLGAPAQALAKRQADWLGAIPGTPRAGTGTPAKDYVIGLAELYVSDERFAANYGGTAGATFVRDAMLAYAEGHL